MRNGSWMVVRDSRGWIRSYWIEGSSVDVDRLCYRVAQNLLTAGVTREFGSRSDLLAHWARDEEGQVELTWPEWG